MNYLQHVSIRRTPEIAQWIEKICGEIDIPAQFSVRLSDDEMITVQKLAESLSRPGMTATVRDAVAVALAEYAGAGKTSSNKTWAIRDALDFKAKGGVDAESVNPFPGQVSDAGSGS